MRSYAYVVATLALFLSLSGGAYAAVTITGRNVANGTLTGKDMRNESIRSADVGGLRVTDFAPGQLPAGPKGDKGDPGVAPKVKVSCKLTNKRRSVSCKVKPVGGESRRLTATVRAAGKKAKATRKGRRTVRVTLNAQKRLSRSTAIRVNVRSGNASTLFALSAR